MLSMNTSRRPPARSIAGMALSLLLALQFLVAPALAQEKQLHIPEHPPTPKQRTRMTYTPDILLVMPEAKADNDDIDKALEEAHGTVVGTIGEGKLRCLIIKTEKGQLEST
ncbi:MAG TPA: hypothetical protein V6D22_06270, partial [Candidatus Obscuribacterales bacterium]